MAQSLEEIAKGLERRFTSLHPYHIPAPETANDYIAVTLEELMRVVKMLPASAPGPDGITTAMIKLLFELSPQALLNLINFSIKNAWIHPDWKVAKIIPLLKKPGDGYTIDNIRPISLTSNLVKLIE